MFLDTVSELEEAVISCRFGFWAGAAWFDAFWVQRVDRLRGRLGVRHRVRRGVREALDGLCCHGRSCRSVGSALTRCERAWWSEMNKRREVFT